MKSLVLLLTTLPLLAQSQPVNIEDFRLPESLFERLAGRLYADFGSSNSETSSPFTRSDESSSAGGAISADYYLLRSGESLMIDWRPTLTGSFSSSRASQRDSMTTYEHESSSERLSLNSRGQASWYGAGQDLWHLYGSLSFYGTYSHYRHQVSIVDTSTADVSRSLGYEAEVGVGVGLGKMREGGSVAAVLRVLERIREEGLLVREPSDGEILSLAQLYSNERGYTVVYERFFKNFFGDLLQKLYELGILETTTFDAYALLRITDVRFERIDPRLFGWRIQAGLEHISYRSKNSNRGVDVFRRGGLDFVVITGEFGRAVSLRTHFSARFGAKWITSENPKSRIDLQGSVKLNYEVGERFEASASASFRRSHGLEYGVQQIQNYRQRTINYGIAGELGVYVEDAIRLSFWTQYSTYDVRRDYFYPEVYASTRFSGSLSLEYRFF